MAKPEGEFGVASGEAGVKKTATRAGGGTTFTKSAPKADDGKLGAAVKQEESAKGLQALIAARKAKTPPPLTATPTPKPIMSKKSLGGSK